MYVQGLVDDTQLTQPNYLTSNRIYSKVGSTQILAVEPSVIHFSGFEVGQIMKQVVRIINKHGQGTRIHIVPPTTPFFKVSRIVFCRPGCCIPLEAVPRPAGPHPHAAHPDRAPPGSAQATCNDKRGLIAPGLEERIELEFCPQAYKCVAGLWWPSLAARLPPFPALAPCGPQRPRCLFISHYPSFAGADTTTTAFASTRRARTCSSPSTPTPW